MPSGRHPQKYYTNILGKDKLLSPQAMVDNLRNWVDLSLLQLWSSIAIVKMYSVSPDKLPGTLKESRGTATFKLAVV